MRKWMLEARKNAKLTIREASSKLGISEGYYSLIESGERQKKLDITLAVKLADVFGVSLDFIVQQETIPE